MGGYILAAGALAGIGAGVGGALGKPGSSPSDNTRFVAPQVNPLADPLVTQLTLDALAGGPLFDANLDQILQQQSPLNQAIAGIRSRPLREDFKIIFERDLREAFAALEEGRATSSLFEGKRGVFSGDEIIPALERMGRDQVASAAGFDSIADLFQAERDFQLEVPKIIENVKQQTAVGLLDLDDLRQQEERRLETDVENTRRDAISAAQFGGFNPGRILEDLSRFSNEVAPSEALARALGIRTAQANIDIQDANQKLQLAGLRLSTTPSVIPALSTPGPADSTGQGIAAGTAAFANALSLLGAANLTAPTPTSTGSTAPATSGFQGLDDQANLLRLLTGGTGF